MYQRLSAAVVQAREGVPVALAIAACSGPIHLIVQLHDLPWLEVFPLGLSRGAFYPCSASLN